MVMDLHLLLLAGLPAHRIIAFIVDRRPRNQAPGRSRPGVSALDLLSVYYPSLVPAAAFGPAATRLNPVFRIGNRKFVLDTALMAAVPRKLLGARVATLADRSVDIVGAVDFLVSGV